MIRKSGSRFLTAAVVLIDGIGDSTSDQAVKSGVKIVC